MDRAVVEQKLESLRRCLKRVQEKCPPDADTLINSPDLQDILVLNLTRAVQLCVDIGAHIISRTELHPPDTMGETFDALSKGGILPVQLAVRLKKAVGFRNIAIHHYEEIDWHIVFSIAREFLPDFEEFARQVTGRL